jgi:DNA-directed RNA polymerase specialized sigma24 family protein
MEDDMVGKEARRTNVGAARSCPRPAPTSDGLWFQAAKVVARWRLPAGLDPDDCVQELCARWLAAPPSHIEPDSITAQRWLGGVLRNVVREWTRRRDHLLEEGGGDTSAEGSTVDCTGRRVSAPDEAADESVCRQRLRAWLLQRLRPLEADIVLAHRWDGESFRAACALHGVFSGHAASSLQRKILRFLSNKAVQRAYLLWLHGEDVPWA